MVTIHATRDKDRFITWADPGLAKEGLEVAASVATDTQTNYCSPYACANQGAFSWSVTLILADASIWTLHVATPIIILWLM